MSSAWKWSLKAGLTLASLALIWRHADGAAALRQLAAAHPAWIFTSLALLTLQTFLSALRWRLTAQQLGIRLQRRVAVREYYLSQIVNQLLPGGVIGDAGRAVRARDAAGLVASGQAVLFERLAGQLALLALFSAAVIGNWLTPGGFPVPAALLLALLFLAAGAGLVLGIALAAPRLESRLARGLWSAGGAFGRSVLAPEVRRRQLLMSLGTALCNIAAFACCAAAVDAPLAPPAALVLVPLILFSMLIPLTVSGWGLREGAAAALFPLAGATGAEGLAASLAFGIAVLVAASPGLITLALTATPEARVEGPG